MLKGWGNEKAKKGNVNIAVLKGLNKGDSLESFYVEDVVMMGKDESSKLEENNHCGEDGLMGPQSIDDPSPVKIINGLLTSPSATSPIFRLS